MANTDVDFIKALKMMGEGKRMYRMAWKGSIASWHIEADTDGKKNLYHTKPDGSKRILEAVLTEDILGKDWWVAL